MKKKYKITCRWGNLTRHLKPDMHVVHRMVVRLKYEQQVIGNYFEGPSDEKEGVVVRITCYYGQVEGTPPADMP